MEFSICYEQFMQPTSDETCEEVRENFMSLHNDDNDKHIKCMALLMLPKMTPRYRCQNDKCCVYICDYCYENTINEKELFKCPYCRNYDYKTYMIINVLRELQVKVMGEDGFRKWYMKQLWRFG